MTGFTIGDKIYGKSLDYKGIIENGDSFTPQRDVTDGRGISPFIQYFLSYGSVIFVRHVGGHRLRVRVSP